MLYQIADNQLVEMEEKDWEQGCECIAIFTVKEWEQEMNIRTNYFLNQMEDHIHFCKLEIHAEYMFGTFHIPIKAQFEENLTFAFYILKNKLIFIDDTGLVKNSIERISSGKLRKDYSLERFLYDILTLLIEDDLLYLATVEKEITRMEEKIVNGNSDNFNYRMLELKKEISRLYRYYSQLTNLGENLYSNAGDFFERGEITLFRIFLERAARLQGETQVLREYAMQVQEVYQSEIGIRQNNVMKVLTVVTTIFLPLTLIAGWYGMNFDNMPELKSDFGYPLVIVSSVLIVIFCLWLFKKKKFF